MSERSADDDFCASRRVCFSVLRRVAFSDCRVARLEFKTAMYSSMVWGMVGWAVGCVVCRGWWFVEIEGVGEGGRDGGEVGREVEEGMRSA